MTTTLNLELHVWIENPDPTLTTDQHFALLNSMGSILTDRYPLKFEVVEVPADKTLTRGPFKGADLIVGDALYEAGAIVEIRVIDETPLGGRSGSERLREVKLSDGSYKIIYRDVDYTLALPRNA